MLNRIDAFAFYDAALSFSFSGSNGDVYMRYVYIRLGAVGLIRSVPGAVTAKLLRAIDTD